MILAFLLGLAEAKKGGPRYHGLSFALVGGMDDGRHGDVGLAAAFTWRGRVPTVEIGHRVGFDGYGTDFMVVAGVRDHGRRDHPSWPGWLHPALLLGPVIDRHGVGGLAVGELGFGVLEDGLDLVLRTEGAWSPEALRGSIVVGVRFYDRPEKSRSSREVEFAER